MAVRIAIAGKGGVGKTTLSAALTHSLVRAGEQVIAVDADPNNCLGRALGLPESLLSQITPLSEMSDLLAERAGKGDGGSFFSINPKVDDLLDRFRVTWNGVSLLVMGTVDEPGAGCVCPESAVLKALLRHLVELDGYSLVMDMDAGLEHLGRGTAKHIGAILIVAEPSAASARTAARIAGLARGLGMSVPGVVMNKVKAQQDVAKVLPYLNGLPVLATLPVDPAVTESEAVPRSGPYLEAVEELRMLLSERLGDNGRGEPLPNR